MVSHMTKAHLNPGFQADQLIICDFRQVFKMQHVLLIGHSFLRRLELPEDGFGMDASRTVISWCEYIRTTPINVMDQLEGDLDVIRTNFVRPDVVILVMGTNDICAKPLASPVDLAWKLIKFGKALLRLGVQRVVLTEVLPRYGPRAFRQCPQFFWFSGVSTYRDASKVFDLRRKIFNRTLKNWAKRCPGFVFIKWRGLHHRVYRYMDGLHLNRWGMKKMAKTLRRTMIRELAKCQVWN